MEEFEETKKKIEMATLVFGLMQKHPDIENGIWIETFVAFILQMFIENGIPLQYFESFLGDIRDAYASELQELAKTLWIQNR